MRGLVRLAAAVVVLVGTVIAGGKAASADPAPEIYPLSKVHRGQTGYGMTTFAGDKPERFTFEVVSVVHNFLPKQDIILVKSDDPKMQTPGFWHGMSGSPLYIDDKLVCAFSYGWNFTKTPLGGCTPLEYMKKEGLETYRRNVPVAAGTGNGPQTVQHQPAATIDDWKRLTGSGDVDLAKALDSLGPKNKNWLTSAPVPTAVPKSATVDGDTFTAGVPLAISGFSAPAFAELSKTFNDTGLLPVRTGGGTAGTSNGSGQNEPGPKAFAMGGALAVQLIRGDMSAAATGTVSYIDGNKVLAFGHPMFQTGETYAPVATATVHTVMPSAQSAFVLASPAHEVGSLVQDRQSAIMADTNLRSPMIPMDITITSGNAKHTDQGAFHVELLDMKFFTPQLAGAAVMNAVQYYLPDRDDVTARVESSVRIKGEKEPIKFVDYMYANDGAGSVMGGTRGLRVLVPLMLNPYGPVSIERIDVKVDLKFEANFGEIKEAEVPTTELVAGQRNLVHVRMTTWNGKDIYEDVPIDVPDSMAGSIALLQVTSGDSASLDGAPPVDLPSLIALIRRLLPGDVWALSLYPADDGVALDGKLVRDLPASAQDKLHPQSHTQRASVYKPIARTLSPSKRVVNGATQMLVKIRAK